MTRKILAGVLALAGLILITLTFFPTRYQEISFPLIIPPTGSADLSLANREVQLTLPGDLPSGEQVMIELTLPARSGGSSQAGQANLIEGRLDLPGVDIFPAAAITAPFHPDQAISFRWLVTAGNESPLPGRLWLTLVSNDSAAGETRTAVLARPVELSVRQILEMPLPEVRWLGGGTAGLGLVFLAVQLRARPKPSKSGRKVSLHSK